MQHVLLELLVEGVPPGSKDPAAPLQGQIPTSSPNERLFQRLNILDKLLIKHILTLKLA